MKTSAAKARRPMTPRADIARVLGALPADGECILTRDILSATKLDKGYVWRKLKLLLADGFVYQHRRGCWKLTPDGEAHRAAIGDAAETVGRRGRGTTPEWRLLYDRLWDALRHTRTAGVADLLNLALTKGDLRPLSSTCAFMGDLVEHGIAQRISPPRKRPVRWALIRDLGPKRPFFMDRRFYDPNAEKFLDRVGGNGANPDARTKAKRSAA